MEGDRAGRPADAAAALALALATAPLDDARRLATDALGVLVGRVDADRASVQVVRDDGTIAVVVEWTRPDIARHDPAIDGLAAADFPFAWGAAWRGEVLAVPDIDRLPPAADPERRSFGSFGVRGLVQVPIAVDGTTIGTVLLNSMRDGVQWDDTVIAELRGHADALAVLLQRLAADERLRAADAAAAAAIRSRDELLMHVHHELRTPLHAILGFAEMLEIDLDDPAHREVLLQIQLNGSHLLELIDDLLALATGARESGDGDEDVPLGRALGDVLERLQPQLAHRGVRVVLDADPGAVLRAHPIRVRRVLYCVVEGAARSMRNGTITIGPAGADASDVHARLESSDPLRDVDATLPLARALLDGVGAISYVPAPDGATADLVVRFTGQVARP